MGFFKRIAAALGLKKREAKILVVGLDNSGKSTLINHLKPKKACILQLLRPNLPHDLQSASYEVVPTVGFTVETFSKNKLQFTAFDMSGQGRYRSLWESYYSGVDVSDSAAVHFQASQIEDRPSFL